MFLPAENYINLYQFGQSKLSTPQLMNIPGAPKLEGIGTALMKEVHKELPEYNFPLYHYTNFSGLFGIINSQKIWLSKFDYLNDSSELDYGFQLLRNIVNDKKITILSDETKQFGLSLEEYLNIYESFSNYYQELPITILGSKYFLACFCQKVDLLSQWRGYTSEADGYCLGFSAKDLVPSESEAAFQLRQVIYNPIRQKEILMSAVKMLWEHYLNETLIQLNDSTKTTEIMPTMYTLCASDLVLQLVSCMKHPNFSEEEEFRLVGKKPFGVSFEELLLRPGKHFPIPYITADYKNAKNTGGFITGIPLAHIICGPSPYLQQKQKAIALMLESRYSAPIFSYYSRTPLR